MTRIFEPALGNGRVRREVHVAALLALFVDQTGCMTAFDGHGVVGVNLWISAVFAVVVVIGCEAAAPWREDLLHVHSAEYPMDVSVNSTFSATGTPLGLI